MLIVSLLLLFLVKSFIIFVSEFKQIEKCKLSGGIKQGTSWNATHLIFIDMLNTNLLKENANVMLTISASDLRNVIDEAVEKSLNASREVKRQKLPKYVNGLKGIRELFGVSHVTAQKYKNTWLAPAVKQRGKVLLIDTEKALKLFAEHDNVGGRE